MVVLRDRFNADAAVPRLVFLVSPTCDICMAGAQAAVEAVLSLPADRYFRLYMVWLPVLEHDSLAAAKERRAEFSRDPRLVHVWDHDLIVSQAYHQVLQLGQRQRRHRVAWDLFLLYRAGVRWEDRPPVPSFWMHQLFIDEVPTLEADVLRHEFEQMLLDQ